MKFPEPLVRATLLRRYKRFLADVEIEGIGEAVAHCANPGSMMGLADPGSEVWLSPNRNPKARLDWRWELVREAGGAMVCINTGHPNTVAAEAIGAGEVPELAGYDSLRREVKYGRNSRIDILLEGLGKPACHVEIKSVTLRRPDGQAPTAAEFPDAVTARGAKHLDELSGVAASGGRAVMLYLVQRGDCDHFRIAADIDPAYAAALRKARRRGVEVLCRACRVSTAEIEIGAALEPVLD